MPGGNPNWKRGGESPNKAGRPRGIVDKRMRLNRAIQNGLDGVVAAMLAKALEGDTSAAALLMARGIAPLRPVSDDSVQFELDTSKPIADQIAQVAQAVANGDLTIEQGTRFSEILQRVASVRALTHDGDHQAELIQAMREMAKVMPV